jgi:hypothetical protein
MSENKLVGSLVLRTFDIPLTATDTPVVTALTPVDTIYGTCTANGCVATWKDVNIRACIGGLYKKHNKFNLKLTAFQVRDSAVATVDAQLIIYISGLPFSSGSTYSTRLGPTNQAALGCVNCVSTTTQGVTTSLLGGLVSFDKPLQDVINITVELKNMSANAAVNGYSEKLGTGILLGHWCLICDIYGIED